MLAQSVGDWALIVVNDGGDAGAVEALLEARRSAFAGRVEVIHNAQSRGMEAASNQALRAGPSDFVVVHDDDDRWHADFLARTTATLAALPARWGGVVTKSMFVRERLAGDSVSEVDCVEFNPGLAQLTLAEMATANQFPPIAFLYRRAALETVGPYREDLPVLGDWEFNLRFLQQFDIALLPEMLAYWHHRVEADAAYRNSSGAAHEPVSAQLRNAALRADLASGRFGLGELMNRHSATLEQSRRREQALQRELEAHAAALRARDETLAARDRELQAAAQREAAAQAQIAALQGIVTTLQRDVGILQGHVEIQNRDVIAVLQRRVETLTAEARERDDRLLATQAELARAAGELQQAIGREQQIASREQEAVAQAQREAAGHHAALAALQTLQHSRSWRLTAPLRALARLLRR